MGRVVLDETKAVIGVAMILLGFVIGLLGFFTYENGEILYRFNQLVAGLGVLVACGGFVMLGRAQITEAAERTHP